MSILSDAETWPGLPLEAWSDTCVTLHMWTQIVGKIRLTLTPWINHSWHVTLYLTSRGLTTSPVPHGLHSFEIRFDFISHDLRILKSDGALRVLPLQPQSVAAFYREVMQALDELQLPVKIDLLPNEITDPIPFDRDETHRAYDPGQANRFWRVLLQSDRVLRNFARASAASAAPCIFSGAFRSRCDPLFRSAGAGSSGRHPAPARCRHTRSLRAGSEQRRLLARQCGQPHPPLLFLCLSRARWVRRGSDQAERSILQYGST